MAVRYPLVVDTTDNNKIKELPSGDSLNLSGNNIVNVVNVTASGTLTVQNLAVETSNFTVNGNNLNTIAFTGSYTDLSNTPTLFDGVYASLTGKPTIPGSIEDLANVGSTAPTNGQVLVYDTTLGRYEPGNINANFSTQFGLEDIDNLNNVIFTGDKTNDVLKFVGGVWVNAKVDYSELTSTTNVVEQGDTLSGSVIGDVKGSIFADDSKLMMDGLTGTLYGPMIGDVTGSVFGDDSTLLVDGVSGTINSSALTMPIQIPDGSISSNYIGFGADDDLKIFHNGNHSIVRETGTGSLYLQSNNNVILGSDSDTETYVKGIYNGAVELYHDNVKKLETTTNGIEVEGSITSNFIGSVFADDSSQMLDAESQTLYGTIVATAGTAPTVSGQPGAVGEIRFDDNYIYVKTSGAGWKRASLSGLV